MQVFENQVVPVTSLNLAFEDRDTSDDHILFTVTHPLREGEGLLEHIDTPFQPVMTFTQDDINHNRVVYRPPSADIGTQEREFVFYFTGQENFNYVLTLFHPYRQL